MKIILVKKEKERKNNITIIAKTNKYINKPAFKQAFPYSTGCNYIFSHIRF